MDSSMSELKFNSPEEEIKYWKEQTFLNKNSLKDLKKEYEEYQEDSKLLEVELETQLKQYEIEGSNLKCNVNRLQNENESLKSHLEQMRREHSAQLTELSTELSAFRKGSDKLTNYVRQLEQKNDDLERTNRAAAVSIEDFEAKLNLAIERNAFLESEIEEKENLRTMVQRLKDETRDLRYELQVRVEPQDSNKLEIRTNINNNRLSPLGIVNDLLKKVGTLESKLATYHQARLRKARQVKS